MRNLKFTMSYDGTNYHGFQIQKEDITIEKALKDAVFKLTEEDVDIIGCGRTDAGVHAINYTFNFKTSSTIPCDKFPIAFSTVLPSDISVTSCEEASKDFHSRFSALKKTYKYVIYTGKLNNPFYNRYSHHIKHPLDLENMKKAAKLIEGEKDFKCFMAQGSPVNDTVRTVYGIEIEKKDDIIEIEVTGNGFLYNMVRIIAGTLVAVGGGKISPSEIENIIDSKKRENAGMTLPPQGLFLKEVFYGK